MSLALVCRQQQHPHSPESAEKGISAQRIDLIQEKDEFQLLLCSVLTQQIKCNLQSFARSVLLEQVSQLEIYTKCTLVAQLQFIQHDIDTTIHVAPGYLTSFNIDVESCVLATGVEKVSELEHIARLAGLPLLVQHKVLPLVYQPHYLLLSQLITAEEPWYAIMESKVHGTTVIVVTSWSKTIRLKWMCEDTTEIVPGLGGRIILSNDGEVMYAILSGSVCALISGNSYGGELIKRYDDRANLVVPLKDWLLAPMMKQFLFWSHLVSISLRSNSGVWAHPPDSREGVSGRILGYYAASLPTQSPCPHPKMQHLPELECKIETVV